MGDAPVVVEGGVSGVKDDGLVEVPQRPARVAHLGVDAPPVVVWDRVIRLQGDGSVEVRHSPGQVSQSGEAGAPAVKGDGVVRFQPDEGIVVLLGKAVFAQVAAGRRPVLQGLGVVRLQVDDPAEVRRRPAVVSQLAVQHSPGQERVDVGGVGLDPFVQARQGSQNLLSAQLVQRPGPIAGVAEPIPFAALVMLSVHGTSPGAVSTSLSPPGGTMRPVPTGNCQSYQSTIVRIVFPTTVGERCEPERVGEGWLLRSVVKMLHHKLGGWHCRPQVHSDRAQGGVQDGGGGGQTW